MNNTVKGIFKVSQYDWYKQNKHLSNDRNKLKLFKAIDDLQIIYALSNEVNEYNNHGNHYKIFESTSKKAMQQIIKYYGKGEICKCFNLIIDKNLQLYVTCYNEGIEKPICLGEVNEKSLFKLEKVMGELDHIDINLGYIKRELRHRFASVRLDIKYFYLNNFSKKYKEECERQNQEELKYFYENDIET